jgi:hypothetical protein
MREFKISDRVGYFVADNALNNDIALREIAKEIDIDPLRQRIRVTEWYAARLIGLGVH